MEKGIYQHYKGKQYEVIGVAKHSDSLEDLVVYRALYDNELSELWVRPIEMFNDSVVLDGKIVARFKKI